MAQRRLCANFCAIRSHCYLLIASAEVAEFGRRAGLRIQWSNPWGFESPLSHGVCRTSNCVGARGAPAPQLLDGLVKRPRKSLQPFALVIHDCWFAARSLASVKPTVRRVRGLAPASGSLILARVFSFLSSIAPASGASGGPNSRSLRFFFITGFWWLVFHAGLLRLLGRRFSG